MGLNLRVSLHDSPGRSYDLAVEADRRHRVETLTKALATALGVDPRTVGLSRANGDPLSPAATIHEAGLVSGEALTLGPCAPDRRPTGEQLQLQVISGPSGGLVHRLDAGTITTLGRAPAGRLPPPGYIAVADRSVSAPHLTIEVTPALDVVIRHHPGVQPVTVGGDPTPEAFRLEPGMVFAVGTSEVTIVPYRPPPRPDVDASGHVPFHRTPFRPHRPRTVELPPLGDLPSHPDPPRFALATALAPLAGGVLMAIMFGRPQFLALVAISPLAIWVAHQDRKKWLTEKFDRSVALFNRRFTARVDEITEANAAEVETRHLASPDPADLLDRATSRSRDLWCHPRAIDEFLCLRLGRGRVASTVTVGADRGEDPYLSQVNEANEELRYLDQVPITVALADLGSLGITAPTTNDAIAVANALLVQAACLHSPEDLVVAAAVSEASGIGHWLKWLPHTNHVGSPLPGRHLATDRPSADRLLAALVEVAEFRAATARNDHDQRWPWILAVIDRHIDADPVLVAQLLRHAPHAGIAVLWISDSPDRVPPQCRAVATVRSGSTALLWFTDPDRPNQTLTIDAVHGTLPLQVALALAPLRDATSPTATAQIPRIVTLFDAYGIDTVTPDRIRQQWASHTDYRLTSILGTGADGPVTLDLVEHGPHGLIGGTSGSGKSELVQSLVAGLVAAHSPRDLTLLFIDFKGGSATEVFAGLPHVVGNVTDLDPALARRAQIAIRAELRSRVELFARHSAADLRAMRRIHPDQAPPSLVIVIDEFATLKNELPDFVGEIIDIAQRGRSYGIHLLLATQRPSNSVDENILANTNLRISLRMLDTAESNAVIGVPDAASIPVPLRGRALARFGPGHLTEFQSAYSGAAYIPSGGPTPITVDTFTPAHLHAPHPVIPPPDRPDATPPPTQLRALIEAITHLNHAPAAPIWTELPKPELPLADVWAARHLVPQTALHQPAPGRLVVIGQLDDPTRKAQYPLIVDLQASGGLLVYGTAGSGRTTALRTLACSAAFDDAQAGGGTVVFHVLDFSSGALRALDALPQVAAVGTVDDLETTTRIIRVLLAEVSRRRRQRRDHPDAAPGPRIVVLVDGYANLADALQARQPGQETSTDDWLDLFAQVVLNGRQVGIHTVMTASRQAEVHTRIRAAMTARLVLRQVDDAEARELGAPSTASMAPGAGYYGPLRAQVALIGGGVHHEDGALAGLARQFPATCAVPAPLRTAPLGWPIAGPPGAAGPGQLRARIGVEDLTLEPVDVDLAATDLLVLGEPGSGRSSTLAVIGGQLLDAGVPVFALGLGDSPLQVGQWTADAWDESGYEPLFAQLDAQLAYPGTRAVLLIDDLDIVLQDEIKWQALCLRAAESQAVRVVSSAVAVARNATSPNKLVTRARKSRHLLSMRPRSAQDVANQAGRTRLPSLRPGLEMPPGRGYLLDGGQPRVIQVYQPEWRASR